MANEAKSLTQDNIARLPRWARVAFAARCARRILPLFKANWPDAPDEHMKAVENAVFVSEMDAAKADVAESTRDAAENAANAAKAAPSNAASAANAAAFAAAFAALAAAEYSTNAAYFAVLAANLNAYVEGSALFDFKNDFWRDFQRLHDYAIEQHWTDDTPVPPSVFGPLWPEGPPPGWPLDDVAISKEIPDTVRGLILDLYANPDTPPDDLREGLVRIYTALNNYHMARGGGVLTIDRFRHLIAEVAPV